MTKLESNYQPGSPEYDRKSNLINQISNSSGRSSFCTLTDIGGELLRNSRLSNGQSEAFMSSIENSRIISYRKTVRDDVLQQPHFDISRFKIEQSINSQKMASMATYEFINGHLDIQSKMGWLVSLLNEGHLCFNRSFDGYDSGISDFIKNSGEYFDEHELHIYENRKRIGNNLRSLDLISEEIFRKISEASKEEFRYMPESDYFLLASFLHSVKDKKDPKFIFKQFQQIMILGYKFGCSDFYIEEDRYWKDIN